MKKILFISLLFLIPVALMSQKVTVEVIKSGRAAISQWQILDEEKNIIFSGKEYYSDESVSFSLEANKRYLLQISVSEILNRDTTIFSLVLNNEPIMLIRSDIGPGDHFFPFFTGIRNEDIKITGGTTAGISDFPWQVYFISGNSRCGGSIIGDDWIITAAHCTKNSFGSPISASDMSVRVGLNNPQNVLDGKTYSVSSVIVNEAFDSQTLENDIALLKLSQPISYPNASPVKLITSDDVAYGATDPGVMSWVTGWGLIRVNPSTLPTSLQKVQLPIISNKQASTVWGSIPSTDMMAGYLNGNKDACSGDSGGPLVVPVFDEYKLAGIVSWGSSNCNTYGAYTRISALESWIRSKTGIQKEYRPPVPLGDTLVCQGEITSIYSGTNISGATGYEWSLIPASAGVVSGNNANATVSWNTGFSGSATLIYRVIVDNVISEWSRLKLKVVLNTKMLSTTADTVICAEQPITLEVNAAGYNLNYKWYKNGNLIQSETSAKVNIPASSTDNSGAYKCEISGFCGTILSDIINLTVHPLTSISGISPDPEVSFDSDVTLVVDARGHDLNYQWQKDSLLLENTNGQSLFLTDVNASDIGLYRVEVKGTCGTVISDIVYVYVKKTDFSGEPEVFLWPSVTSGEFNLALSNDASYNVYIFNSTGQVILEKINCRYQTSVNLNNSPVGTYIVRVSNNVFRKSLKVIKK